jgi:hypothetical protein
MQITATKWRWDNGCTFGSSYFSLIAFWSGHRMLNCSSCMMKMDFCRSETLYPVLCWSVKFWRFMHIKVRKKSCTH